MKISAEQIVNYDLDAELTPHKVIFFDAKLQDGYQGYFMKGPIATFNLYDRSYDCWFWQGYAFYLVNKSLRMVPIIQWDEDKSEYQVDRRFPNDIHEELWQFSHATCTVYDVDHELLASIFTYFGVKEPSIDKIICNKEFQSKMSKLMQISVQHFAEEVCATAIQDDG